MLLNRNKCKILVLITKPNPNINLKFSEIWNDEKEEEVLKYFKRFKHHDLFQLFKLQCWITIKIFKEIENENI